MAHIFCILNFCYQGGRWMLERLGEWILDNEKGLLIHTQTLTGFKFDFESMTHHVGNRASDPKPIRYDSEEDMLLYWGSKKWNEFNGALKEPTLRLFHNYCEGKILGAD